MTTYSDSVTDMYAALFAEFGDQTSVTVDQGSTQLTGKDAVKVFPRREEDGSSMDRDSANFLMAATELSGVTPSPGMTLTENSRVWVVRVARNMAQGTFWALECDRRQQRGGT